MNMNITRLPTSAPTLLTLIPDLSLGRLYQPLGHFGTLPIMCRRSPCRDGYFMVISESRCHTHLEEFFYCYCRFGYDNTRINRVNAVLFLVFF